MAETCKIEITSPLSNERVDSKTYDDILSYVHNTDVAEHYYNQLNSDNFKSWFGDYINSPELASKVVNELGEPLLLFHGTSNEFSAFDKKFSRETGFHFGTRKAAIERRYHGGLDLFKTDINEAERELKSELGYKLLPVFLNIRNLIEGVDYLEADEELNQLTISKEDYSELINLGKKQIEETINNSKISRSNIEFRQLVIAFYQKGTLTKQQARDILLEKTTLQKELNADGYWYTNLLEDKGSISYVVFEPENIKSLYNRGIFSAFNPDLFAQAKSTESSKASKQTIEKVKTFLNRIGVDIATLNPARFGGVNAIADLTNNLIHVALGQEDKALTEEAMHFATALIKQANSSLYKQMMNKIGQYQIYKSVLEEYGKRKEYQINGKPDVVKLKEEAIGKVLAEYFIKHNEGSVEKPELLKQSQSWWEKFKEWLHNLIGKYGNPFQEAVSSLDTLQKTSVKGELAQTNSNKVNATLKAIGILSSDKAEAIFKKGIVNNWTLNKILTELQVPKDQQALLTNYNTINREELLANLLADYSYTIEINTAKESYLGNEWQIEQVDEGYDAVNKYTKERKFFIELDDAYAFLGDNKVLNKPTQHYSNLTVPGGTNYTENEISTPLITPSIKGHAQFATDNGIGWFRSDEQDKTIRTPITSANELPDEFKGLNGYTYTKWGKGWLITHPDYESELETDTKELIEIYNYSSQKYEGSKTRRILEVQSDIFQKGRDIKSPDEIINELKKSGELQIKCD